MTGAAACQAKKGVGTDLNWLQQLQRLNCPHLQVRHDHLQDKLRTSVVCAQDRLHMRSVSHQVTASPEVVSQPLRRFLPTHA